MIARRRTASRLLAATVLAALAIGGLIATSAPASATSIGQLSSQLGAQQARQQSLSASLGRLAQVISSLDGQISLVQSREAAVRAELTRDPVAHASAQAALVRERA